MGAFFFLTMGRIFLPKVLSEILSVAVLKIKQILT